MFSTKRVWLYFYIKKQYSLYSLVLPESYRVFIIQGGFVMPKIKTHSGAKKRFKLTKNGKVKRGHAFISHQPTLQSTKKKRHLRGLTVADKTNVKAIKLLIPYK